MLSSGPSSGSFVGCIKRYLYAAVLRLGVTNFVVVTEGRSNVGSVVHWSIRWIIKVWSATRIIKCCGGEKTRESKRVEFYV